VLFVINLQRYNFNLISKKCLKILSNHPVYSYYTYGTIALVALFLFICTFEYPQAASQTWFSQSERQQAALRVFSEIQFVPVRVFPTFFPPPRHRVHSEKYIRQEKERGRKKGKQATRGVHAELFKWAAQGGARNSVKFRAKREKSCGRIRLREFWNPRLYEW